MHFRFAFYSISSAKRSESFGKLLLLLGLLILWPDMAQARARLAAGLDRELRQQKMIGPKSKSVPKTPFLRTNALGMWQIYVHYTTDTVRLADLESQMLQAGAQGIESCLPLKVIQAWIQPEQINILANLAGVNFIGFPRLGHPRTGSVLTQGDRVLEADKGRQQFGVTGKGVKVGVISDGVLNNAASKLTGDLPTSFYVRSSPGGLGEGDEGTAMMEIVHDLAPDAQLGFGPTRSDVEFINSVNDLADKFGADIIVDDVGFYTDPIFEAGPVALACQGAVKFKGVHYFSAAGNNGLDHYESFFKPGIVQQRPVGTTGQIHAFSKNDQFMTIGDFGGGSTFAIVLYWNDPFEAPSSKYRIHLYANNTYTKRVASSTNFSNYFFDHDVAAEVLEYQIPENLLHQPLALVVERISGPANRFAMLLLPDGYEYSQNQGTDSIWGHAGIPEVNCVGAVRHSTPEILEPFSSQGPSTVFFPFYVERSKPDFLATDGVAVTGAGGFPSRFFGTSAAAPHAAAVAALILERNHTLTPSQLQQLMQSTAVRLSTSWFNYREGWGRIDALNALNAVNMVARNLAKNWTAYE